MINICGNIYCSDNNNNKKKLVTFHFTLICTFLIIYFILK